MPPDSIILLCYGFRDEKSSLASMESSRNDSCTGSKTVFSPPVSCRLLFAFIELIISVFFWLHRFDNRFAAPISSRLLLLSSCGAMTKDNKIGHNVKSGGRSLMSDKSSIKAFFKQKQNGN